MGRIAIFMGMISSYIQLSPSEIHDLFLWLSSPPKAFWVCGNNELLQKKNIFGIVWPRKISRYQLDSIQWFEKYLPRYDCSIISWWAEWTDMIAHTIALETATPTIVVLWCWINKGFLWRKRNFLQRVVNAWWAVCSEFDPDQWWAHWTYPRRNRIITYLSNVLFIPWVKVWWWTAYSYKYACDQKKVIYVLPWHAWEEWFTLSNRWIAEWKCILFYWYEVCLQLFKKKEVLISTQKNTEFTFTKKQNIVLQCLKNKKTGIKFDEMLYTLNISAHELLVVLSELNLNWIISEIAPWVYKHRSLSWVNGLLW